MATASKSTAKFNVNQYADVIRGSALRILETVQVKLEQTQEEGRIALSRQILNSANRVGDLSKALTELSEKVAPVAKPKAKAASRVKAKPVAKKPAVKTVAVKTRARKVAVAG